MRTVDVYKKTAYLKENISVRVYVRQKFSCTLHDLYSWATEGVTKSQIPSRELDSSRRMGLNELEK